ncbi:MAG: M14 family metallopeptidase [Bacteroidota bacterium]
MPKACLSMLVLMLYAQVSVAQVIDLSFLQTRPEETGFEETSSYAEVMAFLEVVAASSERVHLTHFGYSVEGRKLPLAVVGDVAAPTAEAVRATGKLRVFVQANIHAGEVCGKEAMLMLLRALGSGKHAAWSDSLVLLIAPIYNADGNERVSLYNRPRQHGPMGGMGQRPNAQAYDLNRDHMKLDSPEARSLVGLMNDFDPHVLVDLHTTNGSYHGYHLTYAPPLHPNTDAGVLSLLRDQMLPAVTARIKAKYDWDYYYYGNVPRSPRAERGWYTFDHRPRFNNNYVGLRNRLAILSEAYAYDTFEDRILSTLYFVEEILNYAHANAADLAAVTEAADASVVGAELGLRATFARSEEPVTILMGEVERQRNPYSGALVLQRTATQTPEPMPEFGTFVATETTTAPIAYYVPPEMTLVRNKLDDHGIQYTTLAEATSMPVQRFRIDSTAVAARPFQGYNERTLFGAYTPVLDETLPAGTLVVPVGQPLGRLAFSLLEPRSDDGLTAWALIDRWVEDVAEYPIGRQPASARP